MKSNYIFPKQTNKFTEKNGVVLCFCKSLTSGFIDESWIFIYNFHINLLWYIVSVKAYGENFALHRYVVGEKGVF